MKFAHLSDLHFGHHVSPRKLRSLRDDLALQSPELLVITGDITDRGRISQFREAIDFLKSLEIPYIAVPGNREIAISAFWEWMFGRFSMRRFRFFFGKSDRILHVVDEQKVVFIGLNSIRQLPSWPGQISRQTRYWLKAQAQAGEFSDYMKVLFIHHPVIPVIRSSSFWAHTLSDAGEILNVCSVSGNWIILQGHKHRSSVMEVRFPQRGSSVFVSACGAPLRSEWDPTYHIIGIDNGRITIHPREFSEERFTGNGAYTFSTEKA
jgi:3',5'-cyclic AMP phosphodiesterase CpdA